MPSDNHRPSWPITTLTRGEARAAVASLVGLADPGDIKDFIVVVHSHTDGKCDMIRVGTSPVEEWVCDIT